MPGQRRPASRDARSPALSCAHRPRSALTASFPILTPPPPPPATGAHGRVRPGLVGPPNPGAAHTAPFKLHELELIIDASFFTIGGPAIRLLWRPDTSEPAARSIEVPQPAPISLSWRSVSVYTRIVLAAQVLDLSLTSSIVMVPVSPACTRESLPRIDSTGMTYTSGSCATVRIIFRTAIYLYYA